MQEQDKELAALRAAVTDAEPVEWINDVPVRFKYRVSPDSILSLISRIERLEEKLRDTEHNRDVASNREWQLRKELDQINAAQPSPAVDLSGLTSAVSTLLETLDAHMLMNDYSGLEVTKHNEPAVTQAIESVRALLSSAPVVREGKMTDELAIIKAVQEYLVDVVRSFGEVSCAAYISTWHMPEQIAAKLGREVLATGKGDAEPVAPLAEFTERSIRDHSDFCSDVISLSSPGLAAKQAKIIRKEIYDTIDARVRNAVKAAQAERETGKGKSEPSEELAVLIAAKLAQLDGVSDEQLGQVVWSGGAVQEPMGDVWSLDYYPKGRAIAEIIATPSTPSQAWNGELPEVPEGDFICREENLGTYVHTDRQLQNYARKAIGAAVAGVREQALKEAEGIARTFDPGSADGHDIAEAIRSLSSNPVSLTEKWISVEERLPDVGAWVNVLVDRELGDFFDRQNKPRFDVYGAQLRSIDGEGYAEWQRWRMADGGPMGSLNHVSHWMPLPQPPASNGNGEGGAA